MIKNQVLSCVSHVIRNRVTFPISRVIRNQMKFFTSHLIRAQVTFSIELLYKNIYLTKWPLQKKDAISLTKTDGCAKIKLLAATGQWNSFPLHMLAKSSSYKILHSMHQNMEVLCYKTAILQTNCQSKIMIWYIFVG